MSRRRSRGSYRRKPYSSKSEFSTSYRTARVGALLRSIIADTLEHIDDPRLRFVSVTGVDVNRDLERAVVWFSKFDDDHDEDVLEAFQTYAARLRRAVAKQSNLRKAPELLFRLDVTERMAERIDKLIAAEKARKTPGSMTGGRDDGKTADSGQENTGNIKQVEAEYLDADAASPDVDVSPELQSS